MNITKENVDALNAVLKVDIVAEDYRIKVEDILKDYRKKASVPGFRKGRVPMGMVKRQFGKSVMIDEVNRLLQESLNKFLIEEKLEILGNPLPRTSENFSWDAEPLSFEFELGLIPEFNVNLKPKREIIHYDIAVDDTLISKEIENLQHRHGKMSDVEVIGEKTFVTGTFINEEKQIEKKSIINLGDVEGEANLKKFLGKKVGDNIELETKGLFKDHYKLQSALGLFEEEVEELNITIHFTVEETRQIQLADLDQELLGKIFPDGSVKTVTELRNKIKEDAEKQFQQQSDQQLLNAITEYLIENTKFDLPVEFLQKWLATTDEKQLTAEEAAEKYNKSEKGLRYQLIQEKIVTDHGIKTDYEELKEYAKNVTKIRMAQYSYMHLEEHELDDIVNRMLSNQDEVRRLQNQLVDQKLLEFYKENMSFKIKSVSHENFIKEVYEIER